VNFVSLITTTLVAVIRGRQGQVDLLVSLARLRGELDALGQFVERVGRATNAIYELFPRSKCLEVGDLFLLLWFAIRFMPTSTPMFCLPNAFGRADFGARKP
jgi:hypothetical protein